ncbi:MAG: DNA topoisomerase VI subunit B [Candidatus Nezhaarchaeota archaeon]|nr:DNA topoisomerase VI subunit B [Candidatus Nezhaarchaeota archaeon]MCX8141544.1 DNA topoisomerase VI subunit B [Candidatus Nezhaarchaeota archaeon]MDW8049811.1 DNA topoisomerase VI subunit B [Nitrososphaerota archaeon]
MKGFTHLSVSDWFYRNRYIAGFTNPARSLYQAVRELVENSLDACEAAGNLPHITVDLKLISGRGAPKIYKLTVSDNGTGIPPQYVPQAFCTVLFGSKFELKQQRGLFGLGVKMAVLYSQITTGRPVEVTTCYDGCTEYHFTLQMDLKNNKPIVLSNRAQKLKEPRRGTTVKICLVGDYDRRLGSKSTGDYIREYLKLTTVANPHATILFSDPYDAVYTFERSVEKLPPLPREAVPHPHGVDVEMLKRMIESSRSTSLQTFLSKNFDRVGPKKALEFLKWAGFNPNKDVKKLTADEIVKLVNALKAYEKFLPPSPDVLSPIGAEELKAAISRLFNPEFVKTVTRQPKSYSGYPFQVEAGIAYGGPIIEGLCRGEGDFRLLFRFANKIPLLFDERGDVCRKVVESMDWKQYKVDDTTPIAIFIHVCSTRIPYKTAGKEMIADVEEIEEEIRFALMECARELRRYIYRKMKGIKEEERLNLLKAYIAEIADNLVRVVKEDRQKLVELMWMVVTKRVKSK